MHSPDLLLKLTYQCLIVSALAIFAWSWTDQSLAEQKKLEPKGIANHQYVVELPPHLRALKRYDTTPDQNPVTDAGATLGRVLFYERALSKNRLISCGSCHSQAVSFDDENRFSIGFEGKITRRHSVGLANAAFNGNGKYLRDERMYSLEAQSLDPIFDPLEMGLRPGEPEKRIASLPYYPKLFQSAFGSPDITEEKIAKALSQFVRSMVSTQSRYDLARNDQSDLISPFPVFSKDENRGKTLFFTTIEEGGAGCALCHETEGFIMLKKHDNGLPGEVSFEDRMLRGASLKNIAVRSPFMHDGRFDTLEEVIEHYSTGVTATPTLSAELQLPDGKPKHANLSAEDKKALLAFLETLTDKAFLTAPKFSNPFFQRTQ